MKPWNELWDILSECYAPDTLERLEKWQLNHIELVEDLATTERLKDLCSHTGLEMDVLVLGGMSPLTVKSIENGVTHLQVGIDWECSSEVERFIKAHKWWVTPGMVVEKDCLVYRIPEDTPRKLIQDSVRKEAQSVPRLIQELRPQGLTEVVVRKTLQDMIEQKELDLDAFMKLQIGPKKIPWEGTTKVRFIPVGEGCQIVGVVGDELTPFGLLAKDESLEYAVQRVQNGLRRILPEKCLEAPSYPVVEYRDVWVQTWRESERGWGIRPDGVSIHLTYESVNNYIREQNLEETKKTGGSIPHEYSYADGQPFKVRVTDNMLSEIQKSKYQSLRLGHSAWTKALKDKTILVIP